MAKEPSEGRVQDGMSTVRIVKIDGGEVVRETAAMPNRVAERAARAIAANLEAESPGVFRVTVVPVGSN